MRTLRDRLTYANVVATIALFLSLGGVSYALTIPRNSVGSSQIRNGQVKNADLGRASVQFRNLGLDTVDGQKVMDDSLTGEDIDESTIDPRKFPRQP